MSFYMKRLEPIFIVPFFLVAGVIFGETIIIDNQSSDYAETGSWSTGTTAPGKHAADYRYILTASSETATATWTPDIPTTGSYEVAVWYTEGSNRADNAKYTVNYYGGGQTFYIDQQTSGGQWNVLGTFLFAAGSSGNVILSNQATPGDVVIADAVRFVQEGTTYGDAYQGMWIQSWVSPCFLTAAETAAMIQTARDNNLNAIFPEVRKRGDAYYISSTEPRASNIDPGYADPLADMIQQAHDTSGGKQYIEVHAWIVPYRVWAGSGTRPAGHVLNEHPEWIMKDYDGNTTDGTTVYIDPGAPEVEDYLVDVVLEIVQNYDVDGIHWDYFRYPGVSWGYNEVSVDRFNTLYSRTGKPDTDDPDWCDFRREQIKALGRKAYAAVKAIDWDVKMSAATINWGGYGGDFTATSAYASVFQDWVGMMAEKILDVNVLMNYKREHVPVQAADYRDWVALVADSKEGRHGVIGPGVYLNYIYNSVTQINYARDYSGIDGTNLYVYQYTNLDGESHDIFWYTIKGDCYNQRRDVPDSPWLSAPSMGILRGTVTYGTTKLDGATVSLSNGVSGATNTDGTGFYAFLELPPGTSYTATASFGGYSPVSRNFDITAGTVTTLDFDLSTAGIKDWMMY